MHGYGKGENKGTAAVRFELLWRDYFRLVTRKFGPRLFRIEGFKNDTSYLWKYPQKDKEVQHTVQRFLEGTTGNGFIDASMRELFLTGYTSNRLRQNVASFLAKHLGIDWRIGAEWYESLLCDYDLSNNWGNWQYNAGVGNDPREARVFNPVKQVMLSFHSSDGLAGRKGADRFLVRRTITTLKAPTSRTGLRNYDLLTIPKSCSSLGRCPMRRSKNWVLRAVSGWNDH